nr:uncharacterized protein At2g17340-like [Ipomoea batatas]GMC55622.1 uncharacterized protein At2g17340-like [Ipomoea batatas]
MSFLASCQNLVPRPWVIDDLDAFILKWGRNCWRKQTLFWVFYHLQESYFVVGHRLFWLLMTCLL